jgi:Subtilase family
MQVSFGASRLIYLMAAVVFINAFSGSAANANSVGGEVARATFAKLAKANKPIKDAEGRIRYIVDLVDDDLGKPARFANASEKIAWKQTKSRVLIDDVTRLLGVKLLGSTSLVGTSFIAYLTEKQVEQFSKDSRVALITEDSYLQPSALWNNTPEPNGQTTPQVRPWGLDALLTSGASSNGGATVYVLDTGVELHADLPGLAAGDRLTAFATDVSGAPINPTGCYSHATHVAGIIGAANDSKGTTGVLPGVRLVSVALGDTNGTSSQPCPIGNVAVGSYNAVLTGYVQGLEKIYQRVLLSNQVGIVNISLNSNEQPNQFGHATTIGLKMRAVAMSSFDNGVGYRGALIVQSAGNQYLDACSYAYDATTPYDGILVVGGLDQNGQPVVPMATFGVPNDDGFLSFMERGSNNGYCVEVWAPGQQVYSTWAANSYLRLSGTSMAAPHVSGFAAWVLENDPSVTTSESLEWAIRSRLVTVAGSGLAMPRLSNTSVTARPTIDLLLNTSRAQNGPLSFIKSEGETQDIKWQAIGASNCEVAITRNGAYYSGLTLGTSGTLATNVPGNPNAYTWTFTCWSPQSSQSSVAVVGGIKRLVTAKWYALTTSTYGSWQLIPSGSSVWWSVAGNGGFDQFYDSTGATSCHIQSFGYTGPITKDPENPNFVNNPFQDSYLQNLLWDSYANTGGTIFPPSGGFATLYFGDTHNSPYGIANFDGYKWRLECKNSDFGTGNSKISVMYGHGQ